ncbi:MAG: VOC family protein [Steroidobacteraceae bacterium]
MSLLQFGQPANGIMQMAYIVKDIHKAMDEWVNKLNVGPWFLLDHFTGINPVYRGQPSRADVTIAMSFAGHMNIELIQPNDAHPSVYKESADTKGFGFHHWGLASSDVDADIARYAKLGMQVAFRAGVPTGGDVAYLDTAGTMPGFIELIQTNPLMERIFAGWHGQALAWDGSNPVRPFM